MPRFSIWRSNRPAKDQLSMNMEEREEYLRLIAVRSTGFETSVSLNPVYQATGLITEGGLNP